MLKKADGLSDEQLRRVLTGSGTSILGLVQHLAEVERYWFGYHLAGAAWDAGQEHGMAVPVDGSRHTLRWVMAHMTRNLFPLFRQGKSDRVFASSEGDFGAAQWRADRPGLRPSARRP